MSLNAKTNRECGRTSKHSILLNNVTAIVFAPVSIIQTEDLVNDNTVLPRSSPTELFEAFKERNNSSMRTRLNESLEEIRLAGWVAPCTLLIKGPLEELEVIKEAWRRHFLRSPEGLLIRDIGSVASVEMEVVQQSPFLPLARALYEAIAALNKNDQPATQQSIVDFLFEVYQYVHVPKLNVIHGCLGILIKEEKIYYNGTGYFVSSPPGPALEDKTSASPTDNNSSTLSKEPIQFTEGGQATSKGDSSEVKTPQQEEMREVENRCTECGGHVKTDTTVVAGQNLDKVAEPVTRQARKKVSTGKNEPARKLSSSSKESNPKEARRSSDFTDKDKEVVTKEKRRRHRKDSNSNSTTSETTSSTSEQTRKKNPNKQNQEGKKPKRNVFSQMACLMSKTFSIADVFQEEENSAPPNEKFTPLKADAQITEDKVGVASNDASVFNAKKSRTEDKKENEVIPTDVDKSIDFRDLRLSIARSRSFVQASKSRQDHASKSISFTANTLGALASEKATGDIARADRRRPHANQTDSVSRNVIFRRSMPPLSSSAGTFPVGIVRPLTNSHTTDYRTVSRSNPTKAAESARKSSASGTPSSTPKMKEKAAGHARRIVQLKDTPKGLESNAPFRAMDNQICRVETPLKQLPCSNAKPQTSSNPKVRKTASTKMRYVGLGSYDVSGNVQTKIAAGATAPFRTCESSHAPSSHDNYCNLTGEDVEHCKCYFHGAQLSTAHDQMSGLLDSQDICLEVSSSDCSDLYHVAGEGYLEVKSSRPRQFVDRDSRCDESLTFIGII